MNKLTHSGAAKAAAVFLLTFFTVIFIASAVVIAVLVDEGVYLDNGASFRQSVYSQCVSDAEDEILYSYVFPYMQNSGNYDYSGDKEYFENQYSAKSSNISITVTDSFGNELFANDTEPGKRFTYSRTHKMTVPAGSYSDENSSPMLYGTELSEGSYSVRYETDSYTDSDGEIRFYVKLAELPAETHTVSEEEAEQQVTVCFKASVSDTLSAKDRIYYSIRIINVLNDYRYIALAVCIASFVLSAVLFVFLLFSAGHSKGKSGIYLEPQDRIPFDIFVGAYLALIYIVIYTVWLTLPRSSSVSASVFGLAELICGFIICMLLTLALILTTAARLKYGKWWENTLIFQICRICYSLVRFVFRKLAELFSNIPLFWKSALIFGIISIFEFIVLVNTTVGTTVVWWFAEKIILGFVVFFTVIDMKKIKRGAEEIASGNTGFKIKTAGMYGDFKRHAEELNRVNDGIKDAVDNRMKSERLKTELITNVSHDLKTPLTSIVNYVDLMKKEDIQPEKARGYLDVLDKQAKRLQKLTIDILEASKASTGNVQVNAERVDVNVFLTQLNGEYAEKLSNSSLSLIVSTAPEETYIKADGRLMQRIFDNLMNNICKYAQNGTRVYVSAKKEAEKAVIEFKNISKYQLNITGDELMERFVRGDISRNTEGSGLGLSIARSLTELQGGTLEIAVDGDLFKAIVTLNAADGSHSD